MLGIFATGNRKLERCIISIQSALLPELNFREPSVRRLSFDYSLKNSHLIDA
jgi:hypothetical protein